MLVLYMHVKNLKGQGLWDSLTSYSYIQLHANKQQAQPIITSSKQPKWLIQEYDKIYTLTIHSKYGTAQL